MRDVRAESERPLLSDREFLMMSTNALLLEHGQPKMSLVVQSPIHQQEKSGKLEVIEHFVALPESGWVGKPVDSLPKLDSINAGVLWITFLDCVQPVSNESLAVSVNGTEVRRTSQFLTSKRDDGQFEVLGSLVGWPTKDQMIKMLSP